VRLCRFDEDDFDHDSGSDLSEMSDLSDDDEDGEGDMEDEDMMHHHRYHSDMEDDEVRYLAACYRWKVFFD
jgi:hypothetical protein